MSSFANAQVLEPVKWSFDKKQISEEIIELQFQAKMDDGWHLYSQNIPEGGPISTSFNFEESNHYELLGETSEPEPIKEFDSNFDMQLKFFDESATFKQKVKVTSEKDFTISGELEYMCCDDSRCLPPEYKSYSFDIAGVEGTSKSAEQQKGKKSETEESKEPKKEKEKEDRKDTDKKDLVQKKTVDKDSSAATAEVSREKLWEPVIDQVKSYEDGKEEGSQAWWVIFFLGFAGGLVALVTPCVWPMIPMTVSFFLKRSGDNKKKGIRDAFTYGLGIIIIYVSIGLGVTLIFGAGALNDLSTNAFFNLFIFFLLVIFAIAFLGGFELTLPSKWTNAMDSRVDKTSGFISIFFMAFTLALVSFSCTGPIIGTLLVEAAVTGARLGPFMGMLGFSLALAIPFTLFAIFPSWLNSMPKSGGWLNSVKVVLGFLELALAFKFLSVADLSYHWGILDRDVFLAIWIVIFSLLGFYFLGKLQFPGDTEVKKIPVARLFLAIITFSFAVYMVPGMWGAPTKAVAAFAPPPITQDFSLYDAQVHAEFNDYSEGMEYARQHGKPVLLDFTGWGCVNCRKMENSVWTDPRVHDMLTKDFVLISLYTDDKTDLPENKTITITENGEKKELTKVGQKWKYLQRMKFGNNSQPFYVILDHQGNLLARPYAFNKSIPDYIQWMQTGLNKFEKQKDN